MVISIDARKAHNKIQHPFMTKTLSKTDIKGIYINKIEAIYNKCLVNITLNGEKLKSSLRSGRRQKCPLSPCLFNIVLEGLHSTIEKVIKCIYIGKK